MNLKFQSITSRNGKFHAGFTSDFSSHYDAAMAIYKRGEKSDFIDTLFAAVKNHRKYDVPIAPALQFWLHKLASQPSKRRAAVEIDAAKIQAAFALASSSLKRPKFTVHSHAGAVRFSMAGEKSKFAGSIVVASPTFGEGFFGSIREGIFSPSRECTAEIEAIVKEFAADPSQAAASYGRMSGSCCFCHKELTTKDSLAAGYGPICAKHYGLAWGLSEKIIDQS